MLSRTDVINQGLSALEEQLGRVPGITLQRASREKGPDALFDAVVSVNRNQKTTQLILSAKNRGEPRYAREAVNALLRVIQGPNLYGVLIAPYISPISAQICREAGIGYVDLSGNSLLSFDQVYILIENRQNTFSKRRDLATLYAPKTERILRVLLSDPARSWRTSDLAKTARASLGMISTVKKSLQDREWVQETQQGFRVSQPEKILEEWSGNYAYRRNAVSEYYTLRPLSEIEALLAKICQREGIAYAFTGFSASNRMAPGVRNQRVMIYIQENEQKVAAELGLKPVSSGANVNLIRPYDEGVFLGTQEVNGARVVSPVQAYLDLKQARGRGEEAAQVLFDEVIQKQWSTLPTITQKR